MATICGLEQGCPTHGDERGDRGLFSQVFDQVPHFSQRALGLYIQGIVLRYDGRKFILQISLPNLFLVIHRTPSVEIARRVDLLCLEIAYDPSVLS